MFAEQRQPPASEAARGWLLDRAPALEASLIASERKHKIFTRSYKENLQKRKRKSTKKLKVAEV